MGPRPRPLYLLVLRVLLYITAVVTFAVGLLWWWMFYVFYLKWVTVFENGRYFDPVDEVVYTDSGMVHGVIAAILWLICAAAVFAVRKLSGMRRDEGASD